MNIRRYYCPLPLRILCESGCSAPYKHKHQFLKYFGQEYNFRKMQAYKYQTSILRPLENFEKAKITFNSH
jgi:hypothetical protein